MMKTEKLAMLFYTDVLERIRQYLFQYNFLLEHSNSVSRFAVPCIRRWMGYFGMLPLPLNSAGHGSSVGSASAWHAGSILTSCNILSWSVVMK